MITGISTYVPSRVLDNEELARTFPDWSASKIFEKTGIRQRHIAGRDQCASDLAFEAARLLLNAHPGAVDWLLFCTQTPDYLLPTSACLLQQRLGLPTSCAAFDFNLGCSGYIYGLSLSRALLESKQATRVLLLTGDTYSRLVHAEDKSTKTIFGDAGTATLLSVGGRARLHSFVLGTDGTGGDELIVRGGASRAQARVAEQAISSLAADAAARSSYLYMNGPEIFNFTLKAVPKLVAEVMERAGLSKDAVDLFVFHQANAFMLEHLRRKIGITPERFVVDLEHFGNTVSSTIPLALSRAQQSGRLRPGMKVLLAGFGVGYSWGACILEWA